MVKVKLNHFYNFTSREIKNYFITGLIILLPLALTISIVQFIFNFLTAPFAGLIAAVFNHYHFLTDGFLFFSGPQTQTLISQILILILIIGVMIVLGMLARWVLFHYLIQMGESVLKRIPFIRGVYKTTQDVVNTVFTTSADSFKQVVMVPFPSSESYSIGLITKECIVGLENEGVAVFVPTTPNPTSGFLMIFQKKDILYLDMTVEEAFKYVVSCGVISSSFNIINQEEIIAKAKEKK
jgi:uncharacterized membrane protein